ncbi:MAG: 2OG-Fe(II) oxygenase [Deltaproteobacteria bacterium]|nr:2OG-Fe(II) oxygenase [Deltaproteobacteria bacterium]MBW2412997.1 2OG-Fe(II) oxygenase [Deltaproteobacteria bacterium]
MVELDYARLEAFARDRKGEFASADPFPHVVIDDFLPPDDAEKVLAEFAVTESGWNHYHHYNEKKLALTDVSRMGPHTQQVFAALQDDRFVAFLAALTGIDALISDPDLDGAGMHQIVPGGFLNVHTDFLSHTVNSDWSRQLNLLVYFNKDWQPQWNGALELWDDEMSRCVESVEPAFNRAVLFHTQSRSFHGHPHRLACPDGETRKSIALYYFRDEHERQALTPTNYRAMPDDPAYKHVLVTVDRWLLRVYSTLKRYTGLRDGMIDRILGRF